MNKITKPNVNKLTRFNSKPPTRPPRRVIPKAELGLTVDLTFNWSRKFGHRDGDLVIKGSKSFEEMPQNEYAKLFLHKCKECSKLCDFSDANIDGKAKVTKSILLKHLTQCFSMVGFMKILTAEMMTEFYKMVSTNLFRALPRYPEAVPVDAKVSFYDNSWPHLSLVYQVLNASLSSHFAANITPTFIYKIISNGLSIDPSERVAVRDFLHSYYSRFMGQRVMIRTDIFGLFSMGQASLELLDFFSSIVQGFNPPLKADHVKFFNQALLPLYTYSELNRYSKALTSCVCKFCEKNFNLISVAFDYLYKHWPLQDSKKQKIYIDSVKVILFSFDKFSDTSLRRAFAILAEGVRSDNVDVAEIALDTLLAENLVLVYKQNPRLIFTTIFEKLYKSAKSHWDEDIKTDSIAALQILSEIDPNIFGELNNAHKDKKNTKKAPVKEASALKTNWMQVFNLAKKNDQAIKTLRLDTAVIQ